MQRDALSPTADTRCFKQPYYRRKLAEKALTKLKVNQRKGKADGDVGNMHVYWCAEHAAWHVGHRRQGKAKAKRHEDRDALV